MINHHTMWTGALRKLGFDDKMTNQMAHNLKENVTIAHQVSIAATAVFAILSVLAPFLSLEALGYAAMAYMGYESSRVLYQIKATFSENGPNYIMDHHIYQWTQNSPVIQFLNDLMQIRWEKL
jgi:hypothetical protein